jgi:hypothetical protein
MQCLGREFFMNNRIDVPHVIQQFGGVAELTRLYCRKYPKGITVKAVEKWRERGIIPMRRWLDLENLARWEGFLLTRQKR